MEWSNPFNSFNSWKGLLYSKNYEEIADWKIRKWGLLPPIEVSLDPIHACNLNCSHCNARRYIRKQMMDKDHLLHLISWLDTWGIKAICFGGGGEPTLHPNLPEAIKKTYFKGLQSAIATNGTTFFKEMKFCKWIGVSVDAAYHFTYTLGKKSNEFPNVIKNIEKMVKINRNVCFKFLIFQYNQSEIYIACKLAKELGVKDFHARPADFRHQGMSMKYQNFYNIPLIQKQFEQCHSLETKDFRVFTVTHKFNENFSPKRRFSQCYAAPICIQLCADGGIYLCPDTRQMPFYKLGDHTNPEEIARIWGGKKHYELVFNSGCKNCKSRCTFSPYNEQCERLFINQDDPMCKEFV